MKKQQNIASKYSALILGVIILVIWELAAVMGWLPQFIIPAPSEILMSLISQREVLFHNSLITLIQALVGLFFGIILAFILAIGMDNISLVRKAIYPYLIVSQTIPTVAIAPILVL